MSTPHNHPTGAISANRSRDPLSLVGRVRTCGRQGKFTASAFRNGRVRTHRSVHCGNVNRDRTREMMMSEDCGNKT
ncbi:hypothetical protein JTE90_007304 [Oedothorax gibbosus]|uniref:Uncharacterized protein n=1 Tax=Oedothorax gibbosus TaxID=931172 RepID=A0AAV6UEB0_9ARAC|nr:hypothetical protein JTE90_007304 [Oedothorax gibbosus]